MNAAKSMSLERASMKSADRKQLVGLRTKDPRMVLDEGAQVAAKAGQSPPMTLIGHVTSSYASSVLGHSIALGLIAGGRARVGQTLYVPMPDGDIEVEVTSPVFYDSNGARINALLRPTGWRRLVTAEVTIDESTAMAVSEAPAGHAALAFWSTALSVYVLWNISTVIGALVGNALGSPATTGLDVAGPARQHEAIDNGARLRARNCVREEP